ncbi:hypothetical protein FoTM2_009137, partial [Fusarium oxysporum f. sp. vasinfectum]
MNPLIWLWLYSLVSAACNVNYAMWSPGFGMTVINDLIPALPQLSIEEFETINGGIDADNIGRGVKYRVPYSKEMTINKPAIWSGNCPKTLLLLGEETTQNTSTPSQQPTLSTSADESTNTPVAAPGTTTDYTATSIASTQKASSPTNSKPTGKATDTTRNKTPTAGSVGSKSTEAAATSGGTHSPLAKQWTCWPSKHSYYLDTASQASKEKAVNDFCKKFKEKPLTPNGDNKLIEEDLVLDAYLKVG